MNTRIALVTGGNRGIGLEICRQLAAAGLQVLLTARRADVGAAAAAELAAEGLPVTFQPLDVTDRTSARRLVKHVADHLGRLDVLVNNAAILIDRQQSILDVDLAVMRQTIDVNVYGPLHLSQMFVPLMRRHGYGRVVNVSSSMGQLANMGGRTSAYRLSKLALNGVTRMLAAELAGENILVNTMDPGWVHTDMGGASAPRTVEQGADTAVWLATLPDGGPSGGFWRDREPFAW